MKASEYIYALQRLVEEHGDLEVESDRVWGRAAAPRPERSWRRVLKGRESKPSFAYESETDDRKGEPVIRV